MARLDLLRIYDEAILSFFRGNLTMPGEDLAPRIKFSSPERPFAFDLTPDSEGHMDTARAMQTLTTPIISVTRLTMQYDLLRNNSVEWRNVMYWDDNKEIVVKSNAPRPWDIAYQLDVLGRYRTDCNQIIQWFMYNITPVKAMQVNFDWPWGVQWIDMMFSEIIDNSELETDERERWIRHTIPFTLQAWAFESFENLGDIPPESTNPNATTSLRRVAKETQITVYNKCNNTILDKYSIDMTGKGTVTTLAE